MVNPMSRKTVLAAVLLLAIFIITGTVSAAEKTEETPQIRGFYFENYAQTDGSVNLNLIFESDLLAVSERAEACIYNFHDDGTVLIYDRGQLREDTFAVEDSLLTISGEGTKQECSWEVVDGLLILHEGEESSVLYPFELNNDIQLGDYSVIEIDEASVAISDEYVDSFIDNLLQGQTTTRTETEGTTQEGDIITISFSGILEGETEPFEGGTGENYTFQLGSGALIDNYEEQLTGQKIGESVDVTVTFPEDYEGPEELKGKTATFATTIHSKTIVETPELSDAWVREYTKEYFPEQMDTKDEFREYCREYLQKNVLHAAIFQTLSNQMGDVEYRNAVLAQMMMNYASANLQETAAAYGIDAQTLAEQLGYSSAENYVQYEASSNIMSALIVDRVMLDLQIRYSQEELMEQLSQDVRMSYGSAMTAEDYMEKSGAVGMWAYTNLQYKYGLVTAALEERAVLVPAAGSAQE